MASVKMTWSGLEELKAQLRQLPVELTGEGGHIVEANGNRAAMDIKSGYPRRTGKMRDSVTVEHRRDRYGAVSTVRNTDRNALSFEVGTQTRHTKLGVSRGSMPAGNIFFPRMRKWRRRMLSELRDMMVRHGLTVTSDEF